MSEPNPAPDKTKESGTKLSQNNGLALFVGSLSENTDQTTLTKYFGRYGEISSVNLISDWTTGASKRCAIVMCKKLSTLAKILGTSKHILDGKKIRVAEAEPERKGTKKISTNCLFVGNILAKTKEADIIRIFQIYGDIEEIKFFRNASTKANTKNCIIEYTDSQAVESAFKSKDTIDMISYGFRISPLKHKTPEIKEKPKKSTTLKFGANPFSPDINDEPEAKRFFSFEGDNLNQIQIDPSPIITPLNSFNLFLKSSCITVDLSKSNNKDLSENLSDFASSTTHNGSGCITPDEPKESFQVHSNFVMMADIFCEDDLAAAFLTRSPFLGSMCNCCESRFSGIKIQKN